VHNISISAVKRVLFVTEMLSYRTVRNCWCHTIFLSVHVPTEDNIDKVKDRFYKELNVSINKYQEGLVPR
jgi:hypothetical protein